MWSLLAKLIDYFDTVPPLLLLIVALPTLRWSRRDYIVYYLGCQFFFNGYANLLNELKKDNLFVYSLNFAWTYFFLSLYFAKLNSSRLITRLILGLVIVFQLNLLETVQSSRTVASFNSLSFGTISLLITLGCLFYYTRQLSIQPKENILKVKDFWYVNGIFTYYTSNFFIFLTYNTLVNQHFASIGVIWKIHNVVFLIMCIYFFIGMQCKTLPEK